MSATHNILSNLADPWHIQSRLRCGSISGFLPSSRIANGLMDLTDISVADLYLYLKGWSEETNLDKIVRTKRDHNVITTAYDKFYNSFIASIRPGRAISTKIAWIIPDECLGALQKGGAEARQWLPWMSLAIVNILQRWRSSRISRLRRAIFKLAVDLDADTNAFYPWEPTFDSHNRIVPMEALYQYERSRLTRASLQEFVTLGLTSINDLRCLHPDAVACAKSRRRPLQSIYQDLNRLTSPSRRPESAQEEHHGPAVAAVDVGIARFRTCRWYVKTGRGFAYCGHAEVRPYAGETGFNALAWCPDCAFYKARSPW